MSREVPILFNTEMVKAILDGRKTQTRRIIKHGDILPSGTWLGEIREGGNWCTNPREDVIWTGFMSENGADAYYMYQAKPGDILWVRETWAYCHALHLTTPGKMSLEARKHQVKEGLIWYRADGEQYVSEELTVGERMISRGRWRPNEHMPREACRLFLKVKSVKAERLQDITEEGAKAEGVVSVESYCNASKYGHKDGNSPTIANYRTLFAGLWDSIYKNWNENPWVWVIEFERVV